MPRWGNPGGLKFDYYNCGGTVEEEATFGGYTIPVRMRVGWHFGLMRVYAARWKSLWSRSAAHMGFAYQFIVYIGVLTLLIHPAAMAPVRIGGRPIPDGVGHAVLAFIFLYFMTVALLTFAMLLTGLDFDSSFSAIVASINNTAHGFGPPGAVHNFHGLTPPQIWICTAAMLLGRLEIFSVIVLFRPAYWRK